MFTTKFTTFKFGEGYRPPELEISQHIPNASPPKNFEIDTLQRLRQQQRKLGLMDASGNLYDPRTKSWASCKYREIENKEIFPNVLDDLEYFEHYPELLKGLPSDVTHPEENQNESSLRKMSI